MLWLLYSLAVVFIILIMIFLVAAAIHRQVFGSRYKEDGIVKYYEISDFKNLKAQAVEIPFKNYKIRGFIYYYEKSANLGLVIFSHGMWGSHLAYMQEIENLANKGYKVLAYDNLGTSLSDGKSILGLGASLLALEAVVGYVNSQLLEIGVSKIFVFGHSWGGFAALGIAKKYPNLTKIVSMSGFISVGRAFKSLLPVWLWFLIPFLKIVDAIKCGKYSFISTTKVLKKTVVPTLYIQSIDDSLVKYSYNGKYLAKVVDNQNLEFMFVKDKNHNPDYSLDAINYSKEVKSKMAKLKGEELLTYRKNIDYRRLGSLDEEVMLKICEFLQ